MGDGRAMARGAGEPTAHGSILPGSARGAPARRTPFASFNAGRALGRERRRQASRGRLSSLEQPGEDRLGDEMLVRFTLDIPA